MALHKLFVDEFYDDSYTLYALHCGLEDYRLAYHLNAEIGLNLSRMIQDLDFEYTRASYSIYEWEDSNNLITWHLIANICKKEEDSLTSSGSLFNTEDKLIRTFNLLPEFKNVNYFLKVTSEGNPINKRKILNSLNAIPYIATAYELEVSEIKSKDNLIFD